MTPVRTGRSNFVYRGPTPDIGDAWTERVPAEGAVYMVWEPDEAERAAIAAGALIRLGIYGREPISPVSLGVTDERKLTAEAEGWRDRARGVLRKAAPGCALPPGYWSVSADVWTALQREGALDPGDHVPTLWGRPLMEFADTPADMLEYVPGRPA